MGTFRGVANWSIRGLGINSSIASIDPAVGTFVDGVYIGINPGAAFDLFDVGSVEGRPACPAAHQLGMLVCSAATYRRPGGIRW